MYRFIAPMFFALFQFFLGIFNSFQVLDLLGRSHTIMVIMNLLMFKKS